MTISLFKLFQDRVVTEFTWQGSQHAVPCWVHHSQFQIHTGQPIPDTQGLFVSAKWVGTIVIETEGMNEGLTDLLGRCGEQVSVVALHASGGLSAKLRKGEEGVPSATCMEVHVCIALFLVPETFDHEFDFLEFNCGVIAFIDNEMTPEDHKDLLWWNK
ncbi:hypothetical protein K439DRAFT_1538908 [Ramaria rubella]|nr:hypothetical protein K439DRAFT_1538908 [Ramaria rubella]